MRREQFPFGKRNRVELALKFALGVSPPLGAIAIEEPRNLRQRLAAHQLHDRAIGLAKHRIVDAGVLLNPSEERRDGRSIQGDCAELALRSQLRAHLEVPIDGRKRCADHQERLAIDAAIEDGLGNLFTREIERPCFDDLNGNALLGQHGCEVRHVQRRERSGPGREKLAEPPH
jgi:hypothetical protein